MPMAGIFMLSSLILVGLKINSIDRTMSALLLMIVSMIYLPWFLVAEISKSELSISGSANIGLPSFITNLPVTNFQIAMAKLKLAANSTLLYHAMLLVAVNYFIFSIKDDVFYSNPWNYLIEHFSLVKTIPIILCLNLFIPLSTWIPNKMKHQSINMMRISL